MLTFKDEKVIKLLERERDDKVKKFMKYPISDKQDAYVRGMLDEILCIYDEVTDILFYED